MSSLVDWVGVWYAFGIGRVWVLGVSEMDSADFGLGLLLITWPTYLFVQRMRAQMYGVVTQASVVRIDERLLLLRWRYWCPVVHYQVDGVFYEERVLLEGTTFASFQIYEEGDVVKIMYHPNNPKRVFFIDSPFIRLWQVVVVLIGTGFVVAGLVGMG